MTSSDEHESSPSDSYEPIPSLFGSLLALRPQPEQERPGWDDSSIQPNNTTGDQRSDCNSLDGLVLSTPVKGSPATKRAIRKKKGQGKAKLTKEQRRLERAAEADAKAKRAEEEERTRIEESMAREKAAEEERIAKEREARQNAIAMREHQLKALADSFTSSLTLGDFLSWVFPGEVTAAYETESLNEEDHGGVGADWRWTQFFRGGNLQRLLSFWSSSRSPVTVRKVVDEFAVQRVLDMVRREAKAVTESKMLWSQKAEVNEDFVLGFNYQAVNKRLTEELAPTSMRLFRQIATSRRQEKDKISAQRAERKLYVTTSSYLNLVGEYSKSNSRSRQILGLYLYATGAQRQCISVLCSLGLGCGYTTLTRVTSILDTGRLPAHREGVERSGGMEKSRCGESGNTRQQGLSQGCSNDYTSTCRESFTATEADGTISAQNTPGTLPEESSTTQEQSTPITETPENAGQPAPAKPQPHGDKNHEHEASGLIRKLSQFCRSAARRIAQDLLYLTLYDNVNISDKVAEQVMGKKDTLINGTCATVVKLHNASADSLLSSSVDEAFKAAKPLTFEDISFTEAERKLWDRHILNTFLRVATTYGGPGLERFQQQVDIDTPESDSRIAVHKTEIYPLPAFEIDESSITGNIEVLEAISEELELDTTSPDFMRHVRLFAGDQLSISRLRSITKYRAGHEGGFQSFRWQITIPGLFHLKMAATQGVLETFFGKPNSSHRNPGSLHHHNLVLDRKPIVLTSLPPFRTTRDLIFHSLYARVLHCLLLVSDHHTLKDLGDNLAGYDTLKSLGIKVLEKFTSASKVADMRSQRDASKRDPSAPPGGDMVLESGILFLRDALALRAFTDAVKSGDSGLVLLGLKNLAFAFRASGRTKYAHEVLFVIHNLTHAWPPKLRKLVLDNWLINTTGRTNAWVELDLLQEHLNFWIKVIYKAHGSNTSWEWLATISPCIDILRKLATQMHLTLGTRQGSRHQTPSIVRDLGVLMEDLAVRKVYVYEAGREFDEDDPPPKDIITEGAIALLSGGESSPLALYNAAFNTLRKRMAVPVVIGAVTLSGSEETREARVPAVAVGTDSTDGLHGGESQNDVGSSAELGAVRDGEEFGSEASGEAESASEDKWESGRSGSEDESILGEETLVEIEEDLDSPGGELTLDEDRDVALEMDVEEAWEDDGDEHEEFLDS